MTQVLILNKWRFKLVNIANTGYYGIIIQIQEYTKIKQRFRISQDIHSVLYQRSIYEILQEIRIKNMREQVGSPNRNNPISLFYYRKNLKNTFVNKNLLSSFVCADRGSKIIKYSPNIKQSYIPLGNITGVMRFIRPLANYYQSKKSAINFQKFRQVPDKQNNNLDQLQYQEKSYSSGSSSQKQEGSSDIQQNISSCQDSQQQSDKDVQSNYEEQEPLKLIYMKQLQKMNII